MASTWQRPTQRLTPTHLSHSFSILQTCSELSPVSFSPPSAPYSHPANSHDPSATISSTPLVSPKQPEISKPTTTAKEGSATTPLFSMHRMHQRPTTPNFLRHPMARPGGCTVCIMSHFTVNSFSEFGRNKIKSNSGVFLLVGTV